MLQVYWKNARSRVIGAQHGLTREEIETVGGEVQKAHRAVTDQIASGRLGYAALPENTSYRQGVAKLVERYRPITSDMVVLGIGGSALGNIALHNALNPAIYNLLSQRKRGGPRLFVLDNVDPALVGETLKCVGRRPKGLLINVISKSGETAETAAQFMLAREMLQRKRINDWASHIVATTDMNKGTLHDIAKADGYAMLPVPDDVGGRFSVLSPVGLFSAAMCGIDIDQLLAGAAAMKARCRAPDWQTNPACVLAAVKYAMYARKGKPMHVMMPYSNRLYSLADWYRQLWAESLGKRLDRGGGEVFAGPTPIKALGTTDQHSQIQLYREGPNDKLVIFMDIDKHPVEPRIPDMFREIPGLGYLAKARFSKLLHAEKIATEFALAMSQRPSITLMFDRITPFSVGEFFFLYEFTTSLMGELLNINAYDQPAVELGKKATFALMGRKGHEDLAREIKPFTRIDKKYLA